MDRQGFDDHDDRGREVSLGRDSKPNATVELEATDVADGWIAAFCTTTVCAPQRVQVTIPASGQAVYQFELIRESDIAAATSGATITGGDASVKVPPAHR